jgi:hypothetical protein
MHLQTQGVLDKSVVGHLPVVSHEFVEIDGIHLAQGGRTLFLVGTGGMAVALLAGFTVNLQQPPNPVGEIDDHCQLHPTLHNDNVPRSEDTH